MEHLKAEAVRLVSDRLGEASTGGEGEAEEGRGNLEPGVNYRQTGSAPRHGDLYFSRRTAEKLGLDLVAGGTEADGLLDSHNPASRYFSCAFSNPQGQLCMCLNRPTVFSEALLRVIQDGPKYGRCDPLPIGASGGESRPILLMNDAFLLKHILSPDEGTPPAKGRGSMQLSIGDGRGMLLVGVVFNLLRACGHVVHCYPQATPPSSTSDDPVEQFLRPYASERTPYDMPTEPLLSSSSSSAFLSALLELSSKGGDAGVGVCRGGACEVDARQFLLHSNRSGKGGYDANIGQIPVRGTDGSLLPALLLAHEFNKAASTTAGHMTCHVTTPGHAFLSQQAMVLQDMHSQARSVSDTRCVLLSGDVECSGRRRGRGSRRGGGGGATVDRSREGSGEDVTSLADVLRIRQSQMMEVYGIKYGDQALSEQLQDMSRRMAEAVLKFELLSHDTQTKVKLETPNEPPSATSTRSDGEPTRFPGAFVLYNYARLSSLLHKHQLLCARGSHPPLPPVEEVDFSLLSDQVEWQLLFQYVLRLPEVVREAARLCPRGPAGVHMQASVKQVCLFLVSLSHLFSSYYSRVKVLMSPEPHLLPLIHARLHLLSALRQVMSNALALLGIQPLDQL